MPVNTLIQHRRGTAAQWLAASAVLGQGILYNGELGFETDTGRYKIGDGSTPWSSLDYSSILPNSSDISGESGIVVKFGVSGIPVVVSTSGFNSSQILDFGSAVSGIVTNISVSAEEILDIVGSGIVGNSGIRSLYDDANNTIYISLTGVDPTLLPVTNIISGTGIGVSAAGSVYTISVTGIPTSLVNNFSSEVSSIVNTTLSGGSVGSILTTGNVTIGGDLTVQGTTTTVNSTVVDIGDNIIRVNTSGLTTGGFEVFVGGDANNSANYRSLVWNVSNNRWEFAGGTANIYTSGTITANSFIGIGSGLTNLDFNNITSNIPDPIITGTLTGDISGSSSVTLTNLGNGTLTINTDIGSGVIVNNDINASANISVSKLQAGSAGQVLQVNSGGNIIWGSIDGGSP